ncbi:putative quinol monooxygenase [Geodermatophilus sp. URMC 64]
MFSLLVQVQVDPERRAEFLAAVTDNAEASVRDEPGCLRFDVCSVEGDENRFLFYELYRDAAAFEEHRAAPHFQAWREAADRTVIQQINTRGDLLVSHTAEALA